jgi:DNA polymerase-1
MKQFDSLQVYEIDIETTGLKPYKGANIFAYNLATPVIDDKDVQIDFNCGVYRLDNNSQRKNRDNWKRVQTFFDDTNKIKVSHNYKFEYDFFTYHGIHVPENTVWHDTMIMSQMLRNLAPSHALDYLCWELCSYSRNLDNRVKAQASARGMNYQRVDKQLMHKYQIADGERPLLLFYTFFPYIRNDEKLYKDYLVELELVKVTVAMERNGLRLSRRNCDKLLEYLSSELDWIQNRLFDMTYEYINLNSDMSIARLLYRKYKLPVHKLTDSGQPSTDKDTLLKLKLENNDNENIEIIDLILKHRSYSDGFATIKSYIKNSDNRFYVRTNINTNRAATTRQSSSEPNLHNVNRDSAEKNLYPVPVRKCIITPKDHVLLVCDYSAIELRILVNESREPELLEALQKDPDADLHHRTLECFLMPGVYEFLKDPIFTKGQELAKKLKSTDKKEYKKKRGVYKNVGFCIAYSGGPNKVALTLAKPLEEIITGDANYRKRFSRIANFTKYMIQQVKGTGYITDCFGRKLDVPQDKPYMASNYIIQRTAARVLKQAQNRVYKRINEIDKNIKMILSVHDSILFYFPKYLLPEKDEILPIISQDMCDVPELSVPLRVEWQISYTNWNDAKDLEVVY